MLFQDRVDAGRRLAFALRRYRDEAPIILGLPRGGVTVAHEVARALGAPLDVWVVRKIGAPAQEELGLGAIAEGGEIYLNDELMTHLGITPSDIAGVVAREAIEVDERVRRFRRGQPPPELEGRTVIVVDDGIATGGTVRAALRAIRRRKPRRLVLAVPVAATSTLLSLRPEVDAVVCLDEDPYLSAIGAYYADFSQTDDSGVLAMLDQAREAQRRGEDGESRPAIGRGGETVIDVGEKGVELTGDLSIPEGATGLVLFAHGSGSSRRSERNRFVAKALQRAGLATLLFDLLTAEEEEEDMQTAEIRFDVELLARRVIGASDWVFAQPETKDLRVGYFGASTGAAAALIAAAKRPELAGAIVSRGGRPDLAGRYLGDVVAPTLLIVGSADTKVLALNRAASQILGGRRKLALVPGATHLFEEPGALEEVARLAGAWFVHYLTRRALDATA